MKQSTNHPLRSSRRASAALAGVLLALGATLGACAEPEDFPDEFDSEARSIEVDPDAPLDAMSTPAAACEGAWAPEAVVSNDDGYMDVAADPTTRTIALMTPLQIELWTLTSAGRPILRTTIPASELGALGRWHDISASPCEAGVVALGSAGVGEDRPDQVVFISDRSATIDASDELASPDVPVAGVPGATDTLKRPNPSESSEWRIRGVLELDKPASLVASQCGGAMTPAEQNPLVAAGDWGVAFMERAGDDARVTSWRAFNDASLGPVTSLAMLEDTAVVGFSSNQLALAPLRPDGPLETLATRATPRQPLALGSSLLIPETRVGWPAPDVGTPRDGVPSVDAERRAPQGPSGPTELVAPPSTEPSPWTGFELLDPETGELLEFGEAPAISAFDAPDGPFDLTWVNGRVVVANSESGLLSGTLSGDGVTLVEDAALTHDDWPDLPSRPQALAALEDVIVALEPGRSSAAFVRLCSQ